MIASTTDLFDLQAGKRAIFCKNYGDIIQMFGDVNIYIKKLKLETGQLIVTSRRKTGFMSSALILFQTISYIKFHRII